MDTAAVQDSRLHSSKLPAAKGASKPPTALSKAYAGSQPAAAASMQHQQQQQSRRDQPQQQQQEQWRGQEPARQGALDGTKANNSREQQQQGASQVPVAWRAPQPANKRTMPSWVDDCFVKDEMAKKSENLANRPFLREGVVPVVGLSLYLQLTYEHDGSHPEHYRGWGRMMGEITHVYDPPEPGVYAVYEGQQVRLSEQQLQQQRSELPVLPPSVFGANATCSCCRSAEQVVKQYGAVHGQRFKGRMWLTNMDKELTPQLGELWSIELIANDNLESMWVLCSMQPEDLEEAEEQEQQEQGVKAAPAVQQQQQQPQQLAKQSQPQSQPQQQQPQRPGPQEQAPAAGDDYGRSRRSGSWEREQQQRQQVGEADGRRRSWERSEKGRERERSRGRGEVAVPGSSTIAAARDARDARGGSAYVPREQQNQQRGGGSGRGDWDRERERDRGHSSRDGLYDRDRVRERGGSGGGGGYGGPGDSAVTDRQRSLSRGSDKHSR